MPYDAAMVSKLSIALALVACVGCKDNQERGKQAPPTQPQPPDRTSAWRERLAPLASGSALLLEYASGIVEIATDGSISATANPAEPAKPVALERLAETLGLPPVPSRRDSAFAPAEGASAGLENPTDVTFAKLGHPSLASGAPLPPKRLTTAFSVAHPHDVSGGIVVLADAGAPAAVLVDVLAQVGGFVAVRKDGALGALPIAVDRSPPAATRPDRRWTELRLDTALELEHVPSPPVAVATVEQLAAALAPLAIDAIDVLVGPETKVADLVRAVGELRAAKVAAIGFGRTPAADSPDAASRRQSGPRVIAWDFAIGGGGKVDAAPFREAFDATLEQMRTCFVAKAAKQKPATMPRTADVRFVVPERRNVSAIEILPVALTPGIEPALAPCIRDAIRAATFPAAMNLPAFARIAFVSTAP
jgi:hypothetical protein